MNTDEYRSMNLLTEKVIGAVFEVSNTLGVGFLEKVYERALVRELGLRGISCTSQTSLAVHYKEHLVGEYFADLLVEDYLVVELKCVDRLGNAHGTVHELSAGVGAECLFTGEFSSTQG